jgi:HPt (histidine-containing phosphotransfer) domain-containing protein
MSLVPDRRNALEEKMKAIRVRFCALAAEEADALEKDWADRTDGAVWLKRIADRAHTITGTAGMLEFNDILEAARLLEQSVRNGLEIQVVQTRVDGLCKALRLVAKQV